MTRGKSKQPNWRRDPDAGLAVIALELDVPDERSRQRLHQHYRAAFELRRALQRDACTRMRIYRDARGEKQRSSPKAVRERLGLTRAGLEARAKQHMEAAPQLAAHFSKAFALHMADSVWVPVERHLFQDASGRRAGMPCPGRWHDFTRIPGRARSHTIARKWETYRLHGTLQGHLHAYGTGTVADVLANPPGLRVLDQPKVMPAPDLQERSWHGHYGALCMVVSLPAGALVLPVRLPSGAGRWARLTHFLQDPEAWHKLDLVRVQDRRARGGWRYYAHLTVLCAGYESPGTVRRRAGVASDRRAGADANVSNVTVVSADVNGHDVRNTTVTLSAADRQAARRRQRENARRARKLERSRRAENPDQYALSSAQTAHNARRIAAGKEPVTFTVPMGPRVSNAAGVPKRVYRKDTLSNTYLRVRAQHAEGARNASRAKKDRARKAAAEIIATHGAHVVCEDVFISAWAKLWGRAQALFAPGMLMTALGHEAHACGGTVARASTYHTRMSQTCLCGAHVPKKLQERTHICPACGLTADRDLVSAALASCVTFTDPEDPTSARVDTDYATELLHELHPTHGPARGSETVNSTSQADRPALAHDATRAGRPETARHPGTGTTGPVPVTRRHRTTSNRTAAPPRAPARAPATIRLNS